MKFYRTNPLQGRIGTTALLSGVAAAIVWISANSPIEVLYFIAITTLGVASTIGTRLGNGSRIDLPLNPTPLFFFTNLAGIFLFAALLWGFYAFSWWLPLAATIVYAIGGSLIIFLITSSTMAPFATMLVSLLGLCLGGACFAFWLAA